MSLEQAIKDIDPFYVTAENVYFVTWGPQVDGGQLCWLLHFLGTLEIIRFEKVYDDTFEIGFYT